MSHCEFCRVLSYRNERYFFNRICLGIMSVTTVEWVSTSWKGELELKSRFSWTLIDSLLSRVLGAGVGNASVSWVV